MAHRRLLSSVSLWRCQRSLSSTSTQLRTMPRRDEWSPRLNAYKGEQAFADAPAVYLSDNLQWLDRNNAVHGSPLHRQLLGQSPAVARQRIRRREQQHGAPQTSAAPSTAAKRPNVSSSLKNSTCRSTRPLLLHEFISEIPRSLEWRKRFNIAAGCPDHDPVMQLFRRLASRPSTTQNGQLSATEHLCSSLARYAFSDDAQPYTRNLVATDDATYTLLLLCWNPGRYSPIHNHPGDGCWMKVLQGCIREVRYQPCKTATSKQHFGSVWTAAAAASAQSEMYHSTPHDASDADTQQPMLLQCIQDRTYSSQQHGSSSNSSGCSKHDDVVFITDAMGYHKVGNPSLTVPAMTLHLYSPPIRTCHVWNEESVAAVDAALSAAAAASPQTVCLNDYYSEYGIKMESDKRVVS